MKSLTMMMLLIAAAVMIGCESSPSPEAAYGYGEDDPYAAAPAYPAPVEVQPAAMTDAAGAGFTDYGGANSYVIQKGDTLWSIAHRQYGDGQRWKDILNANPGLQPTKMTVGQTITLP